MTNSNDDAPGSGPGQVLRWQLQALRRDIQPAHDLWPDIANRIADMPRQAASTPRRVRSLVPWALAASVLLAVGFVWQLMPASGPQAVEGNPLIRQQAVSMTLEYEGALARMEQAGTHPEMKPALGDLDRSAAQILTAIDHDPEARFLLDQLRRTYARRLQLTQRATMT